MEHAICYISTATLDFTDQEILELLQSWKEKNSSLNIRGILLYSQGHFFQVLEGEKRAVLGVFHTIQKDSRHKGIIQVMGKDIDKGSVDGYVINHLRQETFSRPDIICSYLESVKGMDRETQQQIKRILISFIDTQVL